MVYLPYPEIIQSYLLPLAVEVAGSLGYDTTEMIEAICKVHDKFNQFPPTKNRTAWFRKVFEEKLREAKGDIFYHRAITKYFGKWNGQILESVPWGSRL